MDFNQPNIFLISSKYRVWRHVAFWTFHILLFAFLFSNNDIEEQLIITSFWIPLRVLYCYPLTHWALPKYLLKAKYVQFTLIILFWAVAAWYGHYLFRAYIFLPLRDYLGFIKNIYRNPWEIGSLLATMLTVFAACMVVLFKHWVKKQQEWLQAEKEKVTAELQLLKAQVHPHFLFNTLNNIYSFSLENSPKTPGLILKLSSLLSYMLYDCKAEEVLLEKEIEIMKNYIDLERERYNDKIDISINIEGDIQDKYITPLLILPFLENAFKHGTSEQLERPWMSVDIAVKDHLLQCKIVNSKNEFVPFHENGVGINNAKKRLEFLYPGKYELKLADESVFFVVSLLLQLKLKVSPAIDPTFAKQQFEKLTHEIALSAHR